MASNREYNPRNAKPPVPFDSDEADSAMERFVKQKYQDRAFQDGHKSAREPTRSRSGNDYFPSSARHDPGSESDDQAAGLPKKTSRFGFRSASSIFPMSHAARVRKKASKHDMAQHREMERERERDHGRERYRSPSPDHRNKPSRVFGQAVDSTEADEADYKAKAGRLREMGFADINRNLTVLRGLSGNMEKTIETLIRLGDGKVSSNNNSRANSPRAGTPPAGVTGLTIDRTKHVPSPLSSPALNNPWENAALQPQSSQSTGTLAQAKQQEAQNFNSNPYQTIHSSNPFGAFATPEPNLEQAMQSLSVSQSQPQALFPNHTGGFPSQSQQQQTPYQQTMTPPIPSIPSQYFSQNAHCSSPQQYGQESTPSQSYNPFLQQQPQQTPTPTASTGNFWDTIGSQQPAAGSQPQNSQQDYTQQAYPSSQPLQPSFQHSASYQGQWQQTNPYQSQQQQQQTNPYQSIHQQSQPQQAPPQLQQQHSYQQGATQQLQYQQYQQQQPQQPQQVQQQQQPLLSQPTGRQDKSSIMALFNYPTSTPTSSTPQMHAQPQIQAQASYQQQQHAPEQQQQPYQSPQQQQQMRSISGPAATFGGNTNPFMAAGSMPSAVPGHVNGAGARGHLSQESVDVGGWMNGRHSPDAFASLSARSMR